MKTRMLQRMVLCGFLGLALGSGVRWVWVFETIDPLSSNDQSLALDSQDRPHLSYFDSQVGDLKYAHFDGQSWQQETVDSEEWVGGGSKIAVDQHNRPHISYYDGTNRDLKYAHFDGQAWQRQTVDGEGGAGFESSIAVDAQGWPHIAYASSQGLKYAHWDGQQWQLEVVESGDGGSPSLALDAAGRPHVAYLVAAEKGLYKPVKYARWDGTQWQREVIPETESAWDIVLRLDGADQPHIIYYALVHPWQVRYVSQPHGQWVGEQLPKPPGCGRSCNVQGYTHLALDAQRRPHVTYLAGGGSLYSGLIHALRLRPGHWQQEVVVQSAIPFLDIEVNSQGQPRISYIQGGSKGPCAGLCYAHAERRAFEVKEP